MMGERFRDGGDGAGDAPVSPKLAGVPPRDPRVHTALGSPKGTGKGHKKGGLAPGDTGGDTHVPKA